MSIQHETRLYCDGCHVYVVSPKSLTYREMRRIAIDNHAWVCRGSLLNDNMPMLDCYDLCPLCAERHAATAEAQTRGGECQVPQS